MHPWFYYMHKNLQLFLKKLSEFLKLELCLLQALFFGSVSSTSERQSGSVDERNKQNLYYYYCRLYSSNLGLAVLKPLTLLVKQNVIINAKKGYNSVWNVEWEQFCPVNWRKDSDFLDGCRVRLQAHEEGHGLKR